jgi:hypothetical protein
MQCHSIRAMLINTSNAIKRNNVHCTLIMCNHMRIRAKQEWHIQISCKYIDNVVNNDISQLTTYIKRTTTYHINFAKFNQSIDRTIAGVSKIASHPLHQLQFSPHRTQELAMFITNAVIPVANQSNLNIRWLFLKFVNRFCTFTALWSATILPKSSYICHRKS